MAFKLKIVNAALDEVGGHIVLRGVIDAACFSDVKVGEYQREEGTTKELSKLCGAIRSGEQLPDIEIGIRGNDYNERDGAFYINHDCYVVDGLQRLSAAKRVRLETPEFDVRLGALLHFGSNEAWERERFKALNLFRRKVSPNVLLRNEVDSPTISTLLSMSEKDREFSLRERICWSQKMSRNHILTALMVVKTVGRLHNHWGPGRSTKYDYLLKSIDKTIETVGVNVWRANVRTFYDVLDQSFGIKAIAYRELSPHIRGPFMFALAEMLTEHQNFWEGYRLSVAKFEIEKLKQFPIRDPGIAALLGSSGEKTLGLLYNRLVNHMNSGRRTRQMTKWNGQRADGLLSLESEQAFADSENDEA